MSSPKAKYTGSLRIWITQSDEMQTITHVLDGDSWSTAAAVVGRRIAAAPADETAVGASW
jgi:hypothetical protein